MISTKTALGLGAILVSVILLSLLTEPVRAESVGKACFKDYFTHCSHTAPYTKACKACFRKVGPRLSPRCQSALRSSSTYAKYYEQERQRYAKN